MGQHYPLPFSPVFLNNIIGGYSFIYFLDSFHQIQSSFSLRVTPILIQEQERKNSKDRKERNLFFPSCLYQYYPVPRCFSPCDGSDIHLSVRFQIITATPWAEVNSFHIIRWEPGNILMIAVFRCTLPPTVLALVLRHGVLL